MKLEVLNTKGEKVAEETLEKELFAVEPNNKVLKDAIILARCSLRQGTHKAKTRAEVRGGGRKPWRQKGTGNAASRFYQSCSMGWWRYCLWSSSKRLQQKTK